MIITHPPSASRSDDHLLSLLNYFNLNFTTFSIFDQGAQRNIDVPVRSIRPVFMLPSAGFTRFRKNVTTVLEV
jgi:hypothetical protein